MPIDDGAPVKLGWRSSLGLDAETAYGTAVDPVTRFLKFNSEGLQLQQQRLESQAIAASEFQTGWGAGSRGPEGDLTVELAGVAQTILWLHALGAVASDQPTDAVDAHRHTFTPDTDELQDLSLTVQVVRDAIPFTYVGCMISQLQLSCDVDQIAQLQASLVGRDELTNVAAAPPSFADPWPLLTFVHGHLEIAAEEVAVNSASWQLNNTLATDRRRWGSSLRRKPQRNGFRELTGSLNADFVDLSLYNRFVTGEEAELVMRFESELLIDAAPDPVDIPYSVELRQNVRFDGTTPTVGGPAEIRQQLEWKAFPSAAIPAGVEVEVVTDSATP